MKHVLIIPSWYPSETSPNTGIFFKEQAEILAKKIEKVGVIAPLFKSLRNFKKIKNNEDIRVINGVITYSKELWSLPMNSRLNSLNWYKVGKKLFENYIKEQGIPEIIHLHSIVMTWRLINYIRIKYNIKYVITEHASGFFLNQFNEKEIEYFRKEINYSSYNIAVSQSLAKILSQEVGSEWGVIPNTIQNIFFEEGNLNLNKPKNNTNKVFITVSNLLPLKGVDILINAFSKLVREKENVVLWIVGDGDESKKLKNLIRVFKVEEKVFFLGALGRNMVINKLKQADFYVSPSLLETFGIVIIEALAMGLPTIATRCGGPESIINDEVGILVEKNSSNLLYDAMKNIIEDEHKFNRMNIINYCKDKYSEDIVRNRIIDIYNKVSNG